MKIFQSSNPVVCWLLIFAFKGFSLEAALLFVSLCVCLKRSMLHTCTMTLIT